MKSSLSRISAYTASAAAAASAQAGIVYSGPQNISIAQGSTFDLNLNADLFGDLRLKNYVYGGGNYQGALVIYSPGLLVSFNANNLGYVTRLADGAAINSGTVGPRFIGSMAYGANNPNAQFNNVTGALLGLSFPQGSSTFYGWVRVDINNAAGTFVVRDWAYESNAGTGIAAGAIPEPSTLGLLALGAAGLAYYRKRRAA